MKYLLILLSFFVCFSLSAQNSNEKNKADSIINNTQKEQSPAQKNSIEVYNQGKILIQQRQVLENARQLNQQIKSFLKSGADTASVARQLKLTKQAIEIVKDGIFVNKGTTQTQRNVAVSSDILRELSERLERQKTSLDNYANFLIDFRVKTDLLMADTLAYSLPNDSIKNSNYLKRLFVIIKEITPANAILNKAIANVEALQVQVDLTVYELKSLREDIDIYSNLLADNNVDKEFPYLWEKPVFARPFAEIVSLSFAKERLTMQYYLQENGWLLIVLLITIGASFLFLHSLKKQLRQENNLSEDFSEQLVVRYPILSAILFSLSIFQFVFPNPPFIFYFFIWLVCAICLLCMFHKYVTAYWMKFWIIIVCFFILAGVDNMILQTSRTERMFNLLLSATGIAYAAFVLSNNHRSDLKEKSIVWFIRFMFACQVISFLLNLFGRFNLSKTFFISGFSGVVIAITFLWVVRIVNNGLVLASSVYKQPSRRLFFLNFNRVGKEIHPVFYVVLVFGWFFLVGKNFYALKKLNDSFLTMITQRRVVGDYSFSIMGMLIFIFILICAVFLSKLVSFFASEPVGAGYTESDKKKFKLGSYILLVRIAVISLGLFFAFAAAGISLNKITIILGALSVGIGLGLQGLISNLVSGLILSFERPVNVGDLIEVNGKPGIMKSIGFRSSIIASSDGSCIIIPNGELLNQHMVNWTMGHNLKKNSFIFSIAFGTDLEKVKNIITKILAADNRIMHSPSSEVYVKDIGESAFQVEVSFWPKHINLSSKVKSDLIEKIDAAFRNESISIPFPQQDLHIRANSEPKD